MMFRVACLALIVGVCLAAPSSVFNQKDRDQLTAFAKKQTFQTPKAIFEGVTILGDDLKKVSDQATLCKSLDLSKKSLEEIYYSVAAGERLGCDLKKAPRDVIDKITDVIDDTSASLADTFAAVSAYVTLSQKGALKLDSEALQPLVSRINDLHDEKGAYLDEENGDASYFATSYALRTLALVHSHGSIEDDDDLLALITVGEQVVEMLKEHESSSFIAIADDKHTSLETTSRVLVGFTEFAKSLGQDLDVTASQMSKIAEFFVSQKSAYSTLSEAHHLITALETLNNNIISIPLAVQLKQNNLQQTSATSTGLLTAVVTDIFGNNPGPCKVVATRATMRGAMAPLLSNQEAYQGKDSTAPEYSFNFFSSRPEPGVYDVQYSITPQGKYGSVSSTTRTVKVSTSAVVGELGISVGEKANKQIFSVNPGKTHPSIAVANGQSLSLSLDVRSATTNKPIKPHQVFARISSGEHEAYFRFTSAKTHTVEIVPSRFAEKLGTSGKFSLTVIVADSNLLEPTVWHAADLELELPAVEAKGESPFKKYSPQPVIEHQFRAAEKRPPATVSNAFSILVLVPGGLLLITILAIGFNFSLFPSGLGGIATLGFLGCLTCIPLLMSAYWFQLSIFQTLQILLVLAPVTALVGNKSLSAIQATRLKHNKQA